MQNIGQKQMEEEIHRKILKIQKNMREVFFKNSEIRNDYIYERGTG
jgi:hypothetical protein